METTRQKYGRVILHVDCNSFFASCEIARDPSLKEKAVVVAGDPKERKGVVLAANYIAKQRFGIYTTMPLWEAKKRCPHLVILKPDFHLYRDTSEKVFQFLKTFTPVLEPASIDEGYLDITDGYSSRSSPLDIAEQIQKGLLKTLHIPVSIGIAPNKFLAKMASDMKKPLGITVLRKRDVPKILWPLPVQQMHGVGDKTAKKLNGIGIFTIGELAKAETAILQNLLGITGVRLKERANGIDPRPVDPEAGEKWKSIGNSTTLSRNVTEERVLLEVLRDLAQSVSKRMKQKHVVSSTIQIMIRYSNFQTITRSKTWENPVQEAEEIFQRAVYLLKRHWNGNPVRLLGITAIDVFDKREAVKQLDLFHFEEDAKKEALQNTIEHLQQKFGDSIIQKGYEFFRR
ncbi:DNA polymerase IV [Parageobacillus thermoglucosidasius]|uniref:DNA polymerase IV n=1 Tax=Parageobacillus thermoglucosidasius TaxID=1426 RepID=A0AAN0YPG5_PARTM|nr:DNA polymerase IV [Parageobacillus thermoglucosidasius]ALF10936.1 DNA polymerase IV [Parageobacillus thermoglucosidasius]ANZ31012.1 DNA polymerase IV [Parageobacillus thermoglucosidasius]APM81749.1 DNA polymerase IV [Parageobacillus thermoglucosidasius]KJX69203.1 DNA polymerase IV [Parageobacillus thermoglucosidasius]MBY6269128.1 DNA polymerase IV [Parageobacillus thermoglucosidasius]